VETVNTETPSIARQNKVDDTKEAKSSTRQLNS